MTTLPEEAAKAAAQADYEARILSALEPSAARQLALEALKAAYASMEGSCSANHRIALNTVDAAIRALSSPDHADAGKVEGGGSRWRVFEAAVGGYWGIELEQARNDDDPILYPIKVHRDTLARIVDAHNAGLPSASSEGAE